MPATRIHNHIKQPKDQICYNTLYQQRIDDINETYSSKDVPEAEYLTRIVNNNLKVITHGDYVRYENKDFDWLNSENYLVYLIQETFQSDYTGDSCLLSGFEVGIDSVTQDFNYGVTFKVYPGLAVINSVLLELSDFVLFDLNFTLEHNLNQIFTLLVGLEYNDDPSNITHEFSIVYYFLDENGNAPPSFNNGNVFNTNILPIGLYHFVFKGTALETISFNDITHPLQFDNPEFDVNKSIAYQTTISQYYYQEVPHQSDLHTRSITPLYTPPKVFNVDDTSYIIPNYGKYINNTYDNARILNQEQEYFGMFIESFVRPRTNLFYSMIYTTSF